MPARTAPGPRPIRDIAADLGLSEEDYEPYGAMKAKVRLSVLGRPGQRPRGQLVLMTGLSPTPAGEGKTTVSIGLVQGLCRLGVRAIAALREPSLGPVFGMKGGGAGGGRAQLYPADEINLHFTGDLHAITAANNLLAAVVDNHLHWGSLPDLDPRSVTWKRCVDMNDRALRDVVTGLGGRTEGVPREAGFDITAASEVMAILALADSPAELTTRLENIVIGPNRGGEPVTAAQTGACGAMAALLRDALKPNLAQTCEGAPAFVHAGPFGNIAHGCSSVLGTRMALALGDVVVTEAGFGADLGAEKFLNIKARTSGLWPQACVIVAAVRALKMHGGVRLEELTTENLPALEGGFPNLQRHVENLHKFGLRPVVAINRFAADTERELDRLSELCVAQGWSVAVADVFADGGAGAEALSRLVMEALEHPSTPGPLYPDDLSLRSKIETVAREIYRADGVEFVPAATDALARLEGAGFGRLPVCMAKTQYSFSDNPALLGAPTGYRITVREVRLSAGAGFVVALAGKMMTMPGLPRVPSAARVRLDPDGSIHGLP